MTSFFESRTKVHAQRKFAQGSNVSSPVITPVKELDREKVKCNDIIQTTTELLPIKRPNTEDFLTFLCFRGTPILPPSLNFFNTANSISTQNVSTTISDTPPPSTFTNVVQEDSVDRPFIAFGVRKRADPFINNKLEKKRRHALALQTLRRKYQEQRMAKIRAVTIEKMSEGIKIKSKNLVRTRSVTRQESNTSPKGKIKVVTKRVKITTRTTVKRPVLKQKMCLRSRGRFVQRELATPVKKRPVKTTKIPVLKRDSSSEFSSDDDQPLVKTLRKTNKISTKTTPTKVTRKPTPSPKKANLIRLTRSTQSSIRLESHISQRPSRKTKEAAALYMELLGRKLVNEAEIDDDDASIDSFPELPNVRRTEQRENEMKAKVKVHPTRKMSTRNMSTTVKNKQEKLNVKSNKIEKSKPVKKATIDSDEDSEKSVEKEVIIKKEPKKTLSKVEKGSTKSEVSTTKTNNKVKIEQSFSDSDEEPLAKLTTQKKNVKPSKNSVTHSCTKSTANKKNVKDNIETLNASNISVVKTEVKIIPKCSLSDDDEEKAFRGFVKTENVNKPTVQVNTCLHSVPDEPIPSVSADLLCKDIGRRFGKRKVNMSTEQIEQWLKDSALAGECSKKDMFEKKYEDDILKYEEKDETKSDSLSILTSASASNLEKPFVSTKLSTNQKKSSTKTEKICKVSPLDEQNVKNCPVTPTTSSKNQAAIERKYIFQQRRTILNKDRKEITPNNSKAFSPDNESSVYAFEAETEMPISTPFRSHVRRPSSTATSRSEDDASKIEDEEKRKSRDGKFRLPAVVKPTTIKNPGKQEVSLTLSADEVNNSASIAVQVNLDSATVFTESNVSMECSTQTDAGEDDGDGHLFYIPLQPGKQTATNNQIIQGVAVKLGTEGSNGQNQRVVMRAKLVTQTPDRLPILGPQQKPLAHSTLMYPPVGTVQPTYRPKPSSEPIKPVMKSIATEPTVLKDTFTSTEIKTAIPSSPSASSSSSAKIYKRVVKPKARTLDMCVPINSTEFPNIDSPAQLVEAPTFHPTEKEFQDPLEFIEKIRGHAEKFGICRIIPPANFKPECKVSDDMRFTAYNQYIHKMLHRWGPNFKELMAIKKYLATQSITFTHPPWVMFSYHSEVSCLIHVLYRSEAWK